MTEQGDSVAQDMIRAFVQRIERMNEERKAIARDISEIYAEAKGNGLEVKALKIVVRRREQNPSERQELEAIVDLYEAALGMAYVARYHDNDEPERVTRERAGAPAREIIEQFDAETGEITQPVTHAAGRTDEGTTSAQARAEPSSGQIPADEDNLAKGQQSRTFGVAGSTATTNRDAASSPVAVPDGAADGGNVAGEPVSEADADTTQNPNASGPYDAVARVLSITPGGTAVEHGGQI